MIHRYSIDEEFVEVVSCINRKEERYVYYDMRPLLYFKYSIYHSNNCKNVMFPHLLCIILLLLQL